MSSQAVELGARLRLQLESVEAAFRTIPQQDRQRPITPSEYPGGSAWTAADHLAHMVESEWGFLAIGKRLVAGDPDPVRLSRRGTTSDERSAFVNKENQERVESRRGQSYDDLLTELRTVREHRIQLVEGLDDEQLARSVPGAPRADLAWGALLGGTRHADAHLEMVQRALDPGASA
jgi:hypothetical protein